MKLKVHGREIDVRVSVIPMINGEGIVMRILDKGAMVFDLRGLGMPQEIFDEFHELITLPHGIVLVTGPTGSGKTTTLYSSLLEIRKPETKDRDHRRPGRVPARGNQPDSGALEDWSHLRGVAAIHPAS